MHLIAFTICSNNYFAHARVLAISWLRHHPNTRVVIVLVDEFNDKVEYDFDSRVDILPIENLSLDNLADLVLRYNIIELNTAVKADAFIKIFAQYQAEKVIYLDPDIQVYSPLDEVISVLDTHSIVVTPHYCTPIDDGHSTSDFKMLGSGLYNLGFIGLSKPREVEPFLTWWRDRIHKYAYCDLQKNMFYDQAWASYITVFFDNYYILKHPGYNMANWNFHEREISVDGAGDYLVNKKYPLRFFHFSGYKLSKPDIFAYYHTRYSFATRPDIVPIYNEYRSELLENNAEEISRIPCLYFERHKVLEAEQQNIEWKRTPLKIRYARKVAGMARWLLYKG